MIIERQLENAFMSTLSAMPDLSAAQIVGSRTIAAAGQTKSEDSTAPTIVAVACGFRQNDAFSLSPISMPMSITIMTRSELDPTSEYHDTVVESIADLLSRWHKYGEEMSEALTTEKFLAGELRMDGGTNRVYDTTNSTWSETLTFTIRGSEKFIPPPRMTTLAQYTDGRTVELDIQGEIDRYSISDKAYVSELDIGNAVTSIGNYAFAACSSLTSVTIPDSVSSIGDYGFSRCSSLSSVTIPDSATSIGYGAFFNCSSLISVTIPDSVTRIVDYAFHGCSGLTSATIGNGVSSIGDWAFYNCRGLTNVTIGDSLASIGDLAFYSCISLTSVEFEGDAPTVGE